MTDSVFYSEMMFPLILIILVVLMAVWMFSLYKARTKQFNTLQKKYNKELCFRKSSEVRLGKIGENLAPFVEGWPWDPKDFRFLGNPVDGVQFNDDEVIFVEIKTGKARLSKSQKYFKDLIKAGKVSFVTFKITDVGIKLIKE